MKQVLLFSTLLVAGAVSWCWLPAQQASQREDATPAKQDQPPSGAGGELLLPTLSDDRIEPPIEPVTALPAADRAANQESDKGRITFDDIVNEVLTKPVEQTPAAVERALRQVRLITILYSGQQVTMPVADGVPMSKVTAAILDYSKGLPDTKLNLGRKALIVSAAPDTAAAVAQVLVKVMFVEPRQAELKKSPKEAPRTAVNIVMPDGTRPKVLEANDAAIEKVLHGARDVSVMLRNYNVIVPLNDKSPRPALARVIGKLVRQDASIGLLDGRVSLLLDPPVGSIQVVIDALTQELVPPQVALADERFSPFDTATAPDDRREPKLPDDETYVKIFKLNHAQADVLEKIFTQLFREDVVVKGDTRTNSLLLKGRAKLLDEVQAIIAKMDQPGSRAGAVAVVDDPNQPLKPAAADSLSEVELRKQYTALEARVAELAERMRTAKIIDEESKTELKAAVAESFALRQRLHQAELNGFQQRMDKVRQMIHSRDQLRTRIIDRRVEELLTPNLNWESDPQRQTKSQPLTSGSPTELEGEWTLESITGGDVLSHEQGLKLRVRDQQWVMLRGEHETPFTLEVNPATEPKSIAITGRQVNGRTPYSANGTYRLDGDKLMITWAKNGGGQPPAFQGASVHTWKRVRKAPDFIQLEITSPKGAAVATLDRNGDIVFGTKDQFHLPIRRMYPTGRAHTLLLSKIPNHAGLELLVTLDLPPMADAARGYLDVNLVSLQLTDEDLQQSRNGAVVKVLYLPTTVVAGAPRGLETMLSTRTDPVVDIIGEARKRGTVVAVFGISKLKESTETGPPQQVYGSPAATSPNALRSGLSDGSEKPRESKAIAIFDPTTGPSTSITVGVVSRVTETGILVISLAEIGSAKVGDEWVLYRPDPFNSPGRMFAKVRVIEAQQESAFVQIIETSRTRMGNEYVYEEGKVGDTVHRPAKGSPPPQPEPQPEGQGVSLEKPIVLKKVEEFQEQFIDLEHTVESHRKSLQESLALKAQGKGSQQSIDANQIQVDAWQKRLDLLRAEYAAQIRLLDLEAGRAKQEIETAQQELSDEQQSDRLLKGPLQKSKVRKLEQALSAAKQRADQAQTLLELYRKISHAASPEGAADAPEPTEAVAPLQKEGASQVDPKQQAKTNLRDLMLALHRYHDQHKHFPPATMLGKDGNGKEPHSWRVEILPHLGEQKLYDEYHFDEPWDSAHNKSLLEKMPAVFRSPLDKPDSHHASYFALVTPGFKPQPAETPTGGAAGLSADEPGAAAAAPRYDKGTVFSNPQGTNFRDILDGTSNTVALIEAKRAIPWTKPLDIPYSTEIWYNPTDPLPPFGGWFKEGWHAGFADGTAKLVSSQNPESVVRALFSIGGGENVKPNLLNDARE